MEHSMWKLGCVDISFAKCQENQQPYQNLRICLEFYRTLTKISFAREVLRLLYRAKFKTFTRQIRNCEACSDVCYLNCANLTGRALLTHLLTGRMKSEVYAG